MSLLNISFQRRICEKDNLVLSLVSTSIAFAGLKCPKGQHYVKSTWEYHCPDGSVAKVSGNRARCVSDSTMHKAGKIACRMQASKSNSKDKNNSKPTYNSKNSKSKKVSKKVQCKNLKKKVKMMCSKKGKASSKKCKKGKLLLKKKKC